MIHYQAGEVETLAQKLAETLGSSLADPFSEDLVLTRTGGLQRWLAEQLASQLGSSGHGDGIAARIKFASLAQFGARLREAGVIWSAEGLLPVILTALTELIDTEAFTQVRAHLGNDHDQPRRRMSWAQATARRLASYATWHAEMLEAWVQSRWEGPDGAPLPEAHLWQAQLSLRVSELLGSTPLADRDRARQAARQQAQGYARIALFCPEELTPLEQALWDGISEAREVMTFSLDQSAPSHPEPRLLAAVQATWRTGTAIQANLDDSIEIYPVHPDRQVETLAERLTSLLENDPRLQPRDILVLVQDLEHHRQLLEAYFRLDLAPGADPRHRIRVGVAPAPRPDDPALDLLVFLLGLVNGRARACDLLDLCRHQLVMAEHGILASDLDRLSYLIASSGMRFGVTAAQRSGQAMEAFSQNTWLAGLGRLVLGVALSEDELLYQGTVLPLDAVDSDTVRLVEALSMIIAAVRQCCQTWVVPCDLAGWSARFGACLEALTGSSWVAGPASRVLARLGRTKLADCPALTITEAENLLIKAWADQSRGSAFLNGELGFALLGSMSLVPHKVIIVYGLDPEAFPRPIPVDGDSITRDFMSEGEDPRQQDRRVFAEVLASCREKFIAIYPGFDPVRSWPTPVPVPLEELLSSAERCVGGEVRDQLVHQPPSASAEPRSSIIPPPALLARPDSAGGPSSIDDLTDLFVNPAGYWLKRQAGLLASTFREPKLLASTMPTVLTALEIWEITNRMLRLLLGGKTADAILQAELRRGILPPGEVGLSQAQDCLATATGIVNRAQGYLAAPLSWLTIDTGDLVGQIGVRGTDLVEVFAGKIHPHHQITAWIKVLCLKSVDGETPWRGVLIGKSSSVILTPGSSVEAAGHLGVLQALYREGRRSPLPAPPGPSAQAARAMLRQPAPDPMMITRALNTLWERDPAWAAIWKTPEQMLGLPSDIPACFSSRFLAQAQAIYTPMLKAGGVAS
ncbi:MAG: exodeoxyribonuclease V subunit gamma [Propionibacteriaceae bacterium]|jgi:exodeoxyribonuclease V gamma subunit|nr:exodeoxyribonuclease V subunit gamma [Propionibacteriaceae bacterium]